MLCPQFAGVRWGSGAVKDVGVETVPGYLNIPKGRQTEEIRVEDPLEPDFFYKNQAGKVSGYAGSTYRYLSDTGSWEVE